MKPFALLLVLSLPAAAQHVTNPKASYIDVPARIRFMQHTKDPLLLEAKAHLPSCLKLPAVAAPPTPIVIPQHYFNGSHGPTNPAEAAATRVYGQFENRITAGMNQYVATGSHEEAKCALDQIDTWRQANALMDYDPRVSSQAWYQVEWTLSSAAIVESVLVNDPALDRNTLAHINAWLDSAAHKMIGFERPTENLNNHHYWRAVGAIATGVLNSDDSLFQYAITAYKGAIDELDANGALPREMARHERASHYQTFALQPLVPLAEFAARQHVNLYTYAPHGKSIKDAIVFFGRSVDDPGIIKQYASEEQDKGWGGGDFCAFLFFTARYPSVQLPPSIAAALKKPAAATRIGGNITVLAAK
jgi:poly(beta-D-mannuronate) lyase